MKNKDVLKIFFLYLLRMYLTFSSPFFFFFFFFENIITGIHFNNKKDNQKLKADGK